MSVEHVVETDVLIIGGGIAGLFAAIKPREQGLDVTIVDKGYAGKSGSSIIVVGESWSTYKDLKGRAMLTKGSGSNNAKINWLHH
jgi:succinate dehydrogenase/fumarate reductase flavoprotein subunit